MNKNTIAEVEKEVKRFMDRLEAVKKCEDYKDDFVMGSPETGALRRSSMDLTRALARLRK